MRKVLLLAFLAMNLIGFGQNIDWLNAFGGSTNDEGFDCTVSADGSMLFCGRLQDTTTIDGLSIQTVGEDFFVAKADTTGVMKWIITGGGTNEGSVIATSISTDANNNIYVGGKYSCDMTIDGVVYPKYADDASDAFVAKLDANGNITWVKTFKGPAYDQIERLCAATDGVALSFRYAGELTVGDKTFSSDYPGISATSSNAAIVKLNGDGDFQWGIKVNAKSSFARDIKVGNTGDVFFISEARMEVSTSPFISSINSSDITPIGNPLGSADLYLCRINGSTGKITWSNRIGSSLSDMSYCLDLDKDDNIYGGLLFQGELQLTSQAAEMQKVALVGSKFDMLTYKYSASGNLQWYNAQGGDKTEGIYDIAVSDKGFVYAAAYMLHPGTVINGNAININTDGGYEALLLSYSVDGNLNWVKSSDTKYTNDDSEIVSGTRLWALDVTPDDKLLFTGSYYGTGTLMDSLANLPDAGSNKDVYYALFDPQDVVSSHNSIKQANKVGLYVYNSNLYITNTPAAQIEIYNVIGKQVKHANYSGAAVNIGELKNGIYIAVVKQEGKILISKKITIN